VAEQLKIFYEYSLDGMYINFKDFRTGYRFSIEFENMMEARLMFFNLNIASFMLPSELAANNKDFKEDSLINISSDL